MDLGGVRAQPQMLWGEDLGPETPVDHPDVSQTARPESSDVVDGSSDSEEEEWKYVKGNVGSENKENSTAENDKKSLLNPNAMEFVPGFPSLEDDEFIAGSPGVGRVARVDLDDIAVPSESEFDRDISTKACELEPVTETDMLNNTASNSFREFDVQSSTNEEKTDNVTLFLSPQISEEVKHDTNPFAAGVTESNLNKNENDHVDLVQDYFGKSELNFKPFESVTCKPVIEEIAENDVESHVTNSVSAEISSHFNFIDSHFDGNELLKSEETEKERNQLEIKEPESPVNSEHITNGICSEGREKMAEIVSSEHDELHSEKEKETLEMFSQEKETLETFSREKETLEMFSQEKETVEALSQEKETLDPFEFKSEEEPVVKLEVLPVEMSPPVCIITDSSNDEGIESEDNKISVETSVHVHAPADGDNLELFKPIVSEESVETVPHHTENMFENEILISAINEASDKVSNVPDDILNDETHFEQHEEKVDCFNDFIEEKVVIDPFECSAPHLEKTDHSVTTELDSNQITVFSNAISTDELISVDEQKDANEVPSPNHGEENNLIPSYNEDFLEECHVKITNAETELSENQDKILDDSTEAEDKSCDDVKENIDEVSSDQPPKSFENFVELAKNNGPNSFNFGQLNEIVITGMSAMECLSRYGGNDIMTTSMHESREPPFEFNAFTEPAEIKDNIQLASDTELVSDVLPHENGISHIESPEQIISVVQVVSNDVMVEVESAIVESHEIPASCEPDIVFVEQICPTVEVRSDETTPVSKENSSFDLASAVITTAGITSVGIGAAALATVLTQDKEPAPTKKEEFSSAEVPVASEKSVPAKAPIAKKPTAVGAKPPASKASATKAAPTKPTSPISAKPKVPATTKPATSGAKKPSSTLSKPGVTTTTSRTVPLSRPTTKSNIPPISKAPSKTPASSAPKPAVGLSKAPSRPSSAPTKPSTLSSKPLATTKTTTAAPRVPAAPRKPATLAARPLSSSKPSTGTDPKPITKPSVPRTTAAPISKPAAPKTTSTLNAKPTSKLGTSVPPTKLKAACPTKPAPIKAKAPLPTSKKSAATPPKKPSSILDKNTKNAVKSVTKVTAPIEISHVSNKEDSEHVTSTTNGHHIENGNVTPHEEIPSQII